MLVRIAIINSDPIILQLFDDILCYRGYSTLCIDDMLQAYQAITEQPPDLILLELHPYNIKESFQLIDSLRNTSTTAHISIIVCSTNKRLLAQSTTRIQAHRCVTLQQPSDIEELFQKIKMSVIETRANSALYTNIRLA